MRYIAVIVIALAGVTATAQSGDEAAIRHQMSVYELARQQGDVAAESAVFTPDAEMWLAARGQWYSGATLTEAFASTPDPSRRVAVEKVTLLGQGAAVVDARYSGGANSGHGVYVFEKRNGRWLIRTGRIVRDATTSPALAQVRFPDRELESAVKGRQRAIDIGDGVEWARYTADDYIQVTNSGQLASKAERASRMVARTPPPPPVIDSVVLLTPDSGVLIQHDGDGANRVLMVWVKRQGQWQVSSAATIPIR